MHKRHILTATCSALLLAPLAAAAVQVDIEAGLTSVFQHASDDRIESELTASIDTAATAHIGNGRLTTYFEYSSTPSANSTAGLVGDANGDAGSALNRDGRARLQLSELHYTLPLGGGEMVFGLMDTGAFIDASDVAGDETSQFLNASLINNPTIAFPDYTLGIGWARESVDGQLGMGLVVERTHGLGADYPSYPSLLDSDIDSDGDGLTNERKGAFVGGELNRKLGDTTLRAGAWVDTSDNPRLDRPSGFRNNYGLFAVAEGALSQSQWSIRAGWADERTSEIGRFLSAAINIPTSYATWGLGISHSRPSSELEDVASTTTAELFANIQVSDAVSIAPTIQWIRNPGFDDSDTMHDDRLTVFSLRFQFNYE